ncbi:MAG: DUF2750 domain-containing protein [Methylotenera sp.]
MSQSAAQATVFFKEVSESGIVWAIKDENGFPSPLGDGGVRAMPFWSSKSRVQAVINNVPAYKGFQPVELELRVFKERWLAGLKKDQFNVGINWSGKNATGYDLSPNDVSKNLEYHEQK